MLGFGKTWGLVEHGAVVEIDLSFFSMLEALVGNSLDWLVLTLQLLSGLKKYDFGFGLYHFGRGDYHENQRSGLWENRLRCTENFVQFVAQQYWHA